MPKQPSTKFMEANARSSCSPLSNIRPKPPNSKLKKSEESTMKEIVIYLMEGMDVLRRENDYIDEVTCSKCSQLLHQPVTATCGHSFCKKCATTSVTCRHCKKIIPKLTFSKVNVVLSAVIEHYFPKKHSYFSLISEGDKLAEKNLFHAAAKKYTEASKLDFCDSYAFEKLAMAHSNAGQFELALADVISAKFRIRNNSEMLFSDENLAKTIAQEKKTIEQVVETISKEISNRERNFSSQCEHFDTSSHLSDWLYTNNVLSELEDILFGIVESNIFELENSNENPGSSSHQGSRKIDFEDNCESTKDVFSCSLCTRVFREPFCTPCGHTFCSECLQRCLDHRPVCPLCQSSMKDLYQYQKFGISTDWSLASIIKNHLPILYEERERFQEEDVEQYRKTLPLFVCAVVFPFVTTKLHVFEPRYRVMLRRAMKFNGGKFGMVGHCPTEGLHKIGTVLQIKNTTFLACGRSIVTCVGTKRFQVLEHDKCDGYSVATKIQYFADVDVDSKLESETQEVANHVYKRAKDWYEERPQNFKRVVEMQCGKFPEQDNKKGENGPDWMWWMHAVIPANNEAKLFVLRQTSVRERLSILNYILKKLESTKT